MVIKDFKNQNYERLKQECLANGTLFEDPYFPADTQSIYRFTIPPPLLEAPIATWKRPFQLIDNPQFITGDITARDLFQGDLGDCWLISATAAVSDVSHEHIRFVVPEDQSFTQGYCGIFHFRFWKFGEWHDVVVDDRLAVNVYNRLAFCSNKKDPREFWGPLVEKAYAKFAGCYEFVHFGCTEDAIVNMTGGVSEMIYIPQAVAQKSKEGLWAQLYRCYTMGSPSSCSIPSKESESPEFRRRDGLVNGHAYSIRKLVTITQSNRHSRFFNFGENETIHLMKIRNPWGNEFEWNGAWSDTSSQWNTLDANVRSELGLVKEFDGEFWMSFDDFVKNFVFVSIVHVDPNAYIGSNSSVSPQKLALNFKYTEFHGESVIDRGYFWSNTQILASFRKSSVGHSNANRSLIVSLMCKEPIREMNRGPAGVCSFDVLLFSILDDSSINDHKSSNHKYQAYELKLASKAGVNSPSQEYTKRFDVAEGNYVVIATVSFQNIPCKYYLRLLTENDTDLYNSHVLDTVGDDILEGGSNNDEELVVEHEDESWRLSN